MGKKLLCMGLISIFLFWPSVVVVEGEPCNIFSRHRPA
jgi:hypothetical protein